MRHDVVLWARKSLPPRTKNDSAAHLSAFERYCSYNFSRRYVDTHFCQGTARNTKFFTAACSRGWCYIAMMHPMHTHCTLDSGTVLLVICQVVYCTALALALAQMASCQCSSARLEWLHAGKCPLSSLCLGAASKVPR